MIKVLALGAIQGLTEFFPVSSSGHLVFAQNLLGIPGNTVFLDISLHLGTLAALGTYFFRDILKAFTNRKVIVQIILVTLATCVIGFPLKKIFESLFSTPTAVAGLLMINGLVLASTVFFKNKQRAPNNTDSLLMGIAQGFAIAPGISRSGSTIAILLARGIKREEAFRFSFIASIPAIIGAFLMEERNTQSSQLPFSPTGVFLGAITAYTFGLLALRVLGRLVQKNQLHFFGYYCLAVGTAFLIFLPR